MKSKILAVFTVIILCISCAIPISSYAALDYNTIVDNTTFLGSMAGGAGSKFIGDMADGLTWDVIQYGLEHPQINAGGDAIESITIPSYTFITGKFTLDCEGMQQIMGEVSFIYCPTIVQNEYFIQKVRNPC